MSKINMQTTFSAAAAVGAVALFSLLSFGGKAEAASGIFNCRGTNASQVTSCCEKYVKKNGMPYWMIEAQTSCKQAAVCRKSKGGLYSIAVAVPAKPCFLQTPVKLKENGGSEDGQNRVQSPTK